MPTTSALVGTIRKIAPLDGDTSVFDEWVNMVNTMFPDACWADCDPAYSAQQIEYIQRLVVAHFYVLSCEQSTTGETVNTGTTTSEEADGIKETYSTAAGRLSSAGNNGGNWNATNYGAMAVLADKCNVLTEQSVRKQKIIGPIHVGSKCSDSRSC